jgi:hypothetical protein
VVVSRPAPVDALQQTRQLGRTQPLAKPTNGQAAVRRDPTWDEWRTVPDSAPCLLLAATPLLDARIPGPVLHPGARYRIASVQNGVAGLYVVGSDGKTGLGYCAAVDLICIDGRFNSHKSGRIYGASANPFRSRMQRLSGGLSQATTSILGAGASQDSRLT